MSLSKYILIPFIIFAVIMTSGWFGLLYIEKQNLEKLEIKSQITAEQTGIRLAEFVNTRLARLDFLRERMGTSPSLTESEFRIRALAIQNELPGFQAINWIDVNGIIQWVTPQASNLPVVGVNLIEKGAQGAATSFSRAMLYRTNTSTGPIALIQGGQGFAVYLPIIVDDKITGFINGVFRLDEMIDQCLGATIRDFNYRVLLAGQSVFLRGEAIKFEQPAVSGRYNFNLLSRPWELQIVPGSARSRITLFMKVLTSIVFLLIAVLVSAFTRYRLQAGDKLNTAYRRIENSERKFRTIFDKSPASLLRFNQAGSFTDWNRAAATLFAFEFPPSEKRNIYKLPGLEPLFSVVRSALAGEATSYSGFIEINDRQIEVNAQIESLTSSSDQLDGGIILLKDVTEENRTQRAREIMYEISALTNKHEDLPQLFAAIQTSLSQILDTRNFYVALFAESTGEFSYPFYADEFDTAPPGPVKDDRGLSAYVLREGVPVLLSKAEIYKLHDQGAIDLIGTPSEQWLASPLIVEGKAIGVMAIQSYSKETVFTGADMGMLNFVSDQIALTIKIKIEDDKLRASEAMHRELSAQLSDSNNIKALLLDIITHDLKNPAGVIASIAELLIEEEQVSDEIRLIKDSSDALLKVIEDTNSLAKITLGEQITMESLDLSTMVKNILVEFTPGFSSKGKPLVSNIEPGLIAEANAVISEVFRNFLSNALKYAPDDQPVDVSLKAEGKTIGFYVRDLGKPIRGADQEAIFGRSVQLANGKSRGSGLGLAIVKRIADVHRAEVGVFSNEPTGNVFYMKLPVHQPDETIV